MTFLTIWPLPDDFFTTEIDPHTRYLYCRVKFLYHRGSFDPYVNCIQFVFFFLCPTSKRKTQRPWNNLIRRLIHSYKRVVLVSIGAQQGIRSENHGVQVVVRFFEGTSSTSIWQNIPNILPNRSWLTCPKHRRCPHCTVVHVTTIRVGTLSIWRGASHVKRLLRVHT